VCDLRYVLAVSRIEQSKAKQGRVICDADVGAMMPKMKSIAGAKTRLYINEV